MQNTYIIAEAGVNHNGDLSLAQRLVETAAEAGANAVKFQTFRTDKLVSRQARKAEYQQRTTVGETQYEMLKALELDHDAHWALARQCRQYGIDFLSTPFDSDSLAFLTANFDLPYIKVASGEVTNWPFLLEIARQGRRIILSTGMSTLAEVEQALSVFAFGFLYPEGCPENRDTLWQSYISGPGRRLLQEKVSLLHCTTEYPAPVNEVNLKAMDTMKECFGLPVGYSDHTAGIAIPVAAAARGAVIIEKHFTLDRSLPGPDHAASLEPEELRHMVASIREIEQALGDGVKVPSASEWKNRQAARKSLVAARDIRAGEAFTDENVALRRPGNGLAPQYYWEVVGRCAAGRDYQKDELIEL